MGQHAAEDQTDGRSSGGDRGVDGEGPRPFLCLGEGHAEGGQRRRGQDGCERTLKGTGGNEDGEVWCCAADRRDPGEPQQPDHQGPSSSEHVRQAATQEQQAAERE